MPADSAHPSAAPLDLDALTPPSSRMLMAEVARLNRVLAENQFDSLLLSWVGTNDSRMVAVLREMYPTEEGVGAVGPSDPDKPACSLRTAIQRAAAHDAATRGPKL